MGTSAWNLQTGADGIALLTLDIPGKSANTMGASVLQELAEVLAGLERAPPKGLIIR